MILRTLFHMAVALALGAHAALAGAQSYPTSTVTMVAPYPAGGTPDLVGRIIAEKVSTILGATVIVEPKPGGNGVIGTSSVANAAPNGYTWLLATLSHVTSPILVKGVSWDPVGSFRGVVQIATAPVVAVVPSSSPANTLRQFVDLAKKEPGKLNYLMPGVGTSMHLNTEMLKLTAGIDIVAIPYRGTPLGLPGLLSGDLSFAMLPLSTALPYLKNGKLKALAIVSPNRVGEIPDVPTMTEAGFPEAQVLSWYAVLVPAKTPKAIIAKANEALSQALADPDVRRRLQVLGVYAAEPNTAEETDAMLRNEASRWSKTLKQLKIDVQ